MIARSGRRPVLIVEDSESCATMLEIALRGLAGIELFFFRRAEDALARIEQDTIVSYRALITDLHLPRMDGFELVRLVRKTRPAGSFPIVIVSGDSDPGTPERVQRLGADAFYRKPYSPAALRRTLEKLLDEQTTEWSSAD